GISYSYGTPFCSFLVRSRSLFQSIRRGGRSPITAVVVVSRTRPFGGHHGRAQRRLWRASFAKGRTLARLFDALQNLAADALARFKHLQAIDCKTSLGIEPEILGPQTQAAVGNRADPAPLSVANFKNFVDQPERRGVSFPAHNSRVLV